MRVRARKREREREAVGRVPLGFRSAGVVVSRRR